MKNQIRTVLGASGATGRAVVKELQVKNYRIRAVERNPKTKDVECVAADLLKASDTIKAINGSTYVYLCIGLQYQAKVWQSDWTMVIQKVINACEKANAILMFLDNVYMYEYPFTVPFSENQPQNPITAKGKVWQRDWTMVIQNVINACEKANAILMFLDNDYMYEYPFPVPFSENQRQNPITEKGKVRKQTADLLLTAIAKR